MTLPLTITTPRLLLRPLRREDGPALLPLISNWNVARWLGVVPWPYRPDDMTEFIDKIALPRQGGSKPIFAILLDGSPIGLAECCGQPLTEATLSNASDLGYWLGEPYWAQGYATEAISALIGRVFAQPEAGVIRSAVFEGNAASLNLQQRLGFEIVGNATTHCRPQGRELSLICTRLTRTRYAALGR